MVMEGIEMRKMITVALFVAISAVFGAVSNAQMSNAQEPTNKFLPDTDIKYYIMSGFASRDAALGDMVASVKALKRFKGVTLINDAESGTISGDKIFSYSIKYQGPDIVRISYWWRAWTDDPAVKDVEGQKKKIETAGAPVLSGFCDNTGNGNEAAWIACQSTKMNVNGHAASTQPKVPPMRTKPNSFCASLMLANATELAMDRVGT